MDPRDYQPSDEERRIVQQVKTWFLHAKRAKAKRQKMIDKCYRYYKGEHYTEAQKLAKHGPKSTRNFIQSSVEDAIALLTDSMPIADCLPRTDADMDAQVAHKGKQGLDWVWGRDEMESKLPMAIRDSLISGMGFLKVYFDPDRDYPYGEVATDVIKVDYIYPDPDATSLETARYIIQASPTPLWMIRKEFPDKGIYVKADETVSEDEPSTDPGVTISAETDREADGAGSTNDVKHERAWLFECWLRDDTVVEMDETDEETGEVKKVKQPKYPNGRRIVVAGDIWLNEDDDANPFEDGEFPYVPLPDYEQTGEFFALGDVEHLIEVNNDINKIVSRLNDYIRQTAHTYLVYDDACNIDERSLEPLEGALIKKEKAGTFEVHAPPPFPDAVFRFLDSCKSDLEIITAIREVTMGRDPKSGKSGVAFERLQEYAMSRLRKKGRNIDNAVKRWARLALSRIKQFYRVERQIRITGDFPIYAQDATGMVQMDQTGQPVIQGRRSYQFLPLSSESFINPQTGESIELDVVIESGVAASVTRMQEREEAIILFDKGIIDDEEVARRFQIKNFKEIQARIRQKQQEQAMMQARAQLQAAMQAGGGGLAP